LSALTTAPRSHDPCPQRKLTMLPIAELIKTRASANSYDTTRPLSDADVAELVELATHAPSAFNLQNWKFVAVRSDQAKAKLHPLAYGQQKVLDAAVTFIVCGLMGEDELIASSLKPTLEAGIIDQATFDGWVGAAQGMYQGNATLQRDEAIRSGSLAAMTLMLAAQGKGLVSCPMIGFNASAVADAFQLSASELPVMLITVGYPGTANWRQKPRKPHAEVLTSV
jgi:nitroreductase